MSFDSVLNANSSVIFLSEFIPLGVLASENSRVLRLICRAFCPYHDTLLLFHSLPYPAVMYDALLFSLSSDVTASLSLIQRAVTVWPSRIQRVEMRLILALLWYQLRISA